MRSLLAALALVAGTAAADRLPTPKPVPAPKPAPIEGRVIQYDVASDGVHATAAAGSDHGVAATDACTFVDGSTRKPTPGDCTIVRVNRRATIVKTTLTTDQLRSGALWVRFTAP